MTSFTDQIGNIIVIDKIPKRIVSLVPSQTELLFNLGLSEEVIGITKFCVRPENWFKTKIRVGGTKNLNIETILSLKPDLIIANKEENDRDQVEELSRHYPVWVSEVNTLQLALQMIDSIGKITNTFNRAEPLIAEIRKEFEKLGVRISGLISNIPTAYLIWKDPYMAAGGDTFIHDMMFRCGLENIFKHILRYPVISMDEIRLANCKLLLLSSEPYPFNQKHLDALQQHLPGTKILLVDGEMFSWYGSRLLYAPAYFDNLLQRLN